MNNHLRTGLVWLVFLGVVLIAYQIFAQASDQRKDLDTSEFYKLVDAGEIQEVSVSGDSVGYDIQGKFKAPQLTTTGQQVPNFRVYTVKDESLMKTLRDKGVIACFELARSPIEVLRVVKIAPAVFVDGGWGRDVVKKDDGLPSKISSTGLSLDVRVTSHFRVNASFARAFNRSFANGGNLQDRGVHLNAVVSYP